MVKIQLFFYKYNKHKITLREVSRASVHCLTCSIQAIQPFLLWSSALFLPDTCLLFRNRLSGSHWCPPSSLLGRCRAAVHFHSPATKGFLLLWKGTAGRMCDFISATTAHCPAHLLADRNLLTDPEQEESSRGAEIYSDLLLP